MTSERLTAQSQSVKANAEMTRQYVEGLCDVDGYWQDKDVLSNWFNIDS